MQMEIAVKVEDGRIVWDSPDINYQEAVNMARMASSAGLRVCITVRDKTGLETDYYVGKGFGRLDEPEWFEPKAPKAKKVREPLVGPKRPPGRPRIDRPETRLVSVQLKAAEIAKVQVAGNGNLSAGIRRAIDLLP